jgi:hypothetical protein
MTYYVGLGVSVKTTSVWIVDEPGKIVKERSLATEPDLSPPGLARPARGRTDIVVLHDGLATRGFARGVRRGAAHADGTGDDAQQDGSQRRARRGQRCCGWATLRHDHFHRDPVVALDAASRSD